jgi:hypothetical protein
MTFLWYTHVWLCCILLYIKKMFCLKLGYTTNLIWIETIIGYDHQVSDRLRVSHVFIILYYYCYCYYCCYYHFCCLLALLLFLLLLFLLLSLYYISSIIIILLVIAYTMNYPDVTGWFPFGVAGSPPLMFQKKVSNSSLSHMGDFFVNGGSPK